MKIGYDFDGVFHKNVEDNNQIGERDYIEGESLIPLYTILDRVKKEIADGHEVFIISRNDRELVLKNLKRLAIDILFKDENIICDLGKKNISKSEIIKEKSIDVFFDDSVYNIHQINREKKKKNINPQLYIVDPVLEKYQRIKSNNIKILSYNVNWENMKAESTAPIKECKKKNVCSFNINKTILNELPLDFILIQEGENEEYLFKEFEKDFQLVETKTEKETMTSFINKKYNIENVIGGKFQLGRPFLVVFLKEKICVINVHMGHGKILKDELKKIEDEIIKSKINTNSYRIILGGDFNLDIKEDVIFLNKRMYKTKTKMTCCIYTTHMYKPFSNLKYIKGKNIDHLLDSQDEPVYDTIITPVDENNHLNAGSDHLGLYVELLA